MRTKIILLVMLMCVFGTASAQTQAEVQAAKSMARQMGYSETEINNLEASLGAKSEGVGTKSVTPAAGVARTVTTQEVAVEERIGGGDALSVANTKVAVDSSNIFGHSVFKSASLNFVPSYNIPTPANYKLAPGDEVVLDIWGGVYQSYAQTISPEGSVTIADIGPVYLVGRTIEQSERYLKSVLSRIYSGLEGDTPNTFLRLTLGKIRSFTINVVGDVEKPGTYTLPSLSTVSSAIYMSGGPKDIGSVRDIRLYRNNKLIETFDAYDFILYGDFSSNIRLEDNDLIIVGPYSNIVSFYGAVKRAMKYEIKDGQTLAEVLEYAGGYSSIADRTRARVERRIGERAISYNVDANQFETFELKDGDIVTIPNNIDRSVNNVSVTGAIWHPGTYAITDTMRTVKDLLLAAGGLKEEAYMGRGYIERLNETRYKVALNFDVEDVMSGKEIVELRADDSVRIFAADELEYRTLVYTRGELNKPSTFVYRPGMTLGDVILMSGGFNVGASHINIDVARRNNNNGALVQTDTVSTVFTFNFITAPESKNFPLMPYDEVFVRTAPNYKKQQTITIAGEVQFPGQYVVETNVVRVSDIVRKAGGFNNDAYIKGSTIERVLSTEEYEKMELAVEMAAKEAEVDSTFIETVGKGERYKIGFDMEEAMENPSSYADVVLNIGDVITVPKMNNTVKITGGVTFENTVVYDPNMKLKDYISQAGGYARHSMRGRTYIVFMNGTIAQKGNPRFKIEPGCQIMVPVKDKESTQKLSAGEIMSIATSTASIATMVVSMVNILKP